MEGINEWAGLIMLAIAIVALIKIVTLISENRNTRGETQVTGNQRRVLLNTGNTQQRNSTETGPMIYYANDRHGRRDREYRFKYKKVGGSWRAYILRMPNLGSRDASGAVTHRLYDNGQPYVCWDSDVNSLKDMQTISRVWADSIQEYIATGKRFG